MEAGLGLAAASSQDARDSSLSLLDRLRAGDPLAEVESRRLYEHLVFQVASDWASRKRGRDQGDVFGRLYEGLATAVERLKTNAFDDTELFIREELERCLRDSYRESSRNLLVPASTNSTRRKRGKAPYKSLRRVDDQIDPWGSEGGGDDSEGSVTERPEVGCLRKDEGGEFYVPSCHINQHLDIESIDLIDMLDVLTTNDDEYRAATMLFEGYTHNEIALALECTIYRAGKLIKALRQRMGRLGLAPTNFDRALECSTSEEPVVSLATGDDPTPKELAPSFALPA